MHKNLIADVNFSGLKNVQLSTPVRIFLVE